MSDPAARKCQHLDKTPDNITLGATVAYGWICYDCGVGEYTIPGCGPDDARWVSRRQMVEAKDLPSFGLAPKEPRDD